LSKNVDICGRIVSTAEAPTSTTFHSISSYYFLLMSNITATQHMSLAQNRRETLLQIPEALPLANLDWTKIPEQLFLSFTASHVSG